jgi:hypothetical protein
METYLLFSHLFVLLKFDALEGLINNEHEDLIDSFQGVELSLKYYKVHKNLPSGWQHLAPLPLVSAYSGRVVHFSRTKARSTV